MRRSSLRAAGAGTGNHFSEERDDDDASQASPGRFSNNSLGTTEDTPKSDQIESNNYLIEVDLIIQREPELDSVCAEQVQEQNSAVHQEPDQEITNQIRSTETCDCERNATTVKEVEVNPLLHTESTITQQDINQFLHDVCVEQTNTFLKPVTPVSHVEQIGPDNSAAATSSNVNTINPSDLSSTKKDQTGYHIGKIKKVELIASDDGPKLYNVRGNFVSPPFITGKLSEAFSSLPVFEVPEGDLEEHKKAFMKKFVGDLDDEQFDKLEQYCSPQNLKTGRELTMLSKFPLTNMSSVSEHKDYLSSYPGSRGEGDHLEIIKRHQLRSKLDKRNSYVKRLKYRGSRFMPLPSAVTPAPAGAGGAADLLYRVRVYRPFPYSPLDRKRSGGRHPLFCYDVVLTGRHTLQELRDRLRCANDLGLRLDVSDTLAVRGAPHDERAACKELFPSAFLFINNVFYTDARAGCRDLSEPLRAWARRRGLGALEVRDMARVSLAHLTLRLGYPEVFVHQGGCEHLLTFSQVRLAGAGGTHSLVAPGQAAHCGCCERGAALLVTAAPDLPFDPALFCAACLDMYLYDARGAKRAAFRAYHYRADTDLS